MPMLTNQDTWLKCVLVKDSFGLWLTNYPWRPLPLESVGGDEEEAYQTLFEDNNDDEGMLINPKFILRMRMEKLRLYGHKSALVRFSPFLQLSEVLPWATYSYFR